VNAEADTGPVTVIVATVTSPAVSFLVTSTESAVKEALNFPSAAATVPAVVMDAADRAPLATMLVTLVSAAVRDPFASMDRNVAGPLTSMVSLIERSFAVRVEVAVRVDASTLSLATILEDINSVASSFLATTESAVRAGVMSS